MDIQKVDMYLAANAKYFEPVQIQAVRDKLMSLDDSKYMVLNALELKDPTTLLLLSIFLGGWGVDRFMLGDIGMGILKILTGGLCGILYIYDICTVSKRAKEINFNSVMSIF